MFKQNETYVKKEKSVLCKFSLNLGKHFKSESGHVKALHLVKDSVCRVYVDVKQG